MNSVPASLAGRLNSLQDNGVIAGWQDAGGPNYGLSKEPLPALIFPITEHGATSYRSDEALNTAVTLLESFGPHALINPDTPPACERCYR
jgi:hypothetical protein